MSREFEGHGGLRLEVVSHLVRGLHHFKLLSRHPRLGYVIENIKKFNIMKICVRVLPIYVFNALIVCDFIQTHYMYL